MALMYGNGGATNRRRRDRRGRYMMNDGAYRQSDNYDAYDEYDADDAYVMPRGRRMGFAQDMNDNDIRRRNTGEEDGWFSEQGEHERYPTGYGGNMRRMSAGGQQGGMRMMRGHADGQSRPRPLTREMAQEWVQEMRGESQKPETWTMEEVEEIAEKHGMQVQEKKLVELYAVMNMMASDYYKVAEKFDVLEDDFFLCMATAFIHEEDAVPDKVAAYYQYVVKKD